MLEKINQKPYFLFILFLNFKIFANFKKEEIITQDMSIYGPFLRLVSILREKKGNLIKRGKFKKWIKPKNKTKKISIVAATIWLHIPFS